MIERFHVAPSIMYKQTIGGHSHCTPVVIVKGAKHAHVFVAGRAALDVSGNLVGKSDMRAQIRKVCENLKDCLESVGADLKDVVRTVTFTTDINEYYRCSDERFKFFTDDLPTSTLLQMPRLWLPEMLVEIEAEAIIEPERLQIPVA